MKVTGRSLTFFCITPALFRLQCLPHVAIFVNFCIIFQGLCGGGDCQHKYVYVACVSFSSPFFLNRACNFHFSPPCYIHLTIYRERYSISVWRAHPHSFWRGVGCVCVLFHCLIQNFFHELFVDHHLIDFQFLPMTGNPAMNSLFQCHFVFI